MVKKLKEEDRAKALKLLSKEPSINLFLIGDIEAFGFHEEFQELWGQHSDNGDLEGILLRFNENYIPYFTNTEFDNTEFMKIILKEQGEMMISGKESIVSKFERELPNHQSRTTYFCELTHSGQLEKEQGDRIRVAQESDAERVYDFIESIEEFNGIGNNIDRIKHKIETGTGRIYYMENAEGEMISVAQTTAENSMSAMVVGVATLKGYRGKGLMSSCLSKLCKDVLLEGKTLCLFYDNPKAGSIYHRLGFQSIDKWMMITKKQD
ncbi:GNAT family N-acetyltransferase [Vallitalea okinawensis]|uniref:GNAT family N-acetyltransferase n=1 Tax=Vallitalea okinawensis TaxID=2078660 RepID=UPI000CFBE131|nr:GNAT family N-acetyltransferase [Vallitalea okinawensis]